MKRYIALAFALLFSLLMLSSCGDSGISIGEDNGGPKVALLVAGEFGDRSFYDSAKEGFERLTADFNLTPITIECNHKNHSAQIRNAGKIADMVICVGWEFYEIEIIAPEYSEVKFIWVDNQSAAPVDNLLNIMYAQNEGSFLVGYIAAAVSGTGTIGAMGAEDADIINDLIVGYEQGASYFASENAKSIKIVKNYSNTYDDPDVGKDCAIALNEAGADVVFQIASACGDGVFEAAAEKGFYAIGADSDQKYIDPEVIICSMKKEIGKSVYDAVSEWIQHEDNDSLFGTSWVAGLSGGYVGIGYGEAGMPQQVPDDVKAAVEELTRKIISGEIAVDSVR